MAESGTLAYGVLWPIKGPRSWLPTWAAAALVGAQGVIADGGTVTLMLSRTALIHIWGHKEGVSLSWFALISLVLVQSLARGTDPWWSHLTVMVT